MTLEVGAEFTQAAKDLSIEDSLSSDEFFDLPIKDSATYMGASVVVNNDNVSLVRPEGLGIDVLYPHIDGAGVEPEIRQQAIDKYAQRFVDAAFGTYDDHDRGILGMCFVAGMLYAAHSAGKASNFELDAYAQ